MLVRVVEMFSSMMSMISPCLKVRLWVYWVIWWMLSIFFWASPSYLLRSRTILLSWSWSKSSYLNPSPSSSSLCDIYISWVLLLLVAPLLLPVLSWAIRSWCFLTSILSCCLTMSTRRAVWGSRYWFSMSATHSDTCFWAAMTDCDYLSGCWAICWRRRWLLALMSLMELTACSYLLVKLVSYMLMLGLYY